MEKVDFETILQYALRSQLSYVIAQPGWDITEQLGWRSSCPYRICIKEVPEVDINVIIEFDDYQQLQWIAVRGTENLKNWLLDSKYVLKHCSQKFAKQTLSIDLHNGFYDASTAVWEAIEPDLNKSYKTRITGHSLGGAIAAILMIFCHYEGLSLERCITFGQPKITNPDGAKQVAHLPLLRVINQEDMVTAVPPNTLLNKIKGKGEYVHFGPEVQLQPDSYAFRLDYNERSVPKDLLRLLNEDVKNLSEEVKTLLGDVQEHYMRNYLDNLTRNWKSSEQIQQDLTKI